MKRCLIYVDHEHLKNSLELLEVARQIHDLENYEVYGFVVGRIPEQCRGHYDYFVQTEDGDVKDYHITAIVGIIADLYERFGFDSILIPGTWIGRMLAPRIAIKLHTGLTADVTAISKDEGAVKMIRPAYSGHMLAGIVNQSNGPILMTVRQNIFSYQGEKTKVTKLLSVASETMTLPRVRRIGTKEKQVTYDIRESKVLVSGGKGISRNFERLDQLADLLDGQVSASRSIVDLELATRSIQVGQSGKTVSPKLYMAFGISGAIQHIEGLREVDYIISVNTDRNAPICSISDLVVEGDAAAFLELLIEQLEQEHKENNQND